jgi:putative sigma-54 modulation protein
MDSSDSLREYAEDKSERFEKYLVEPVEVHWVLSVEKIRQKAEATIVAKHLTIKAEDEEGDMYAAIDLTMDKLEKQLRKHKEKIKNHKFGEKVDAGYKFDKANEAKNAEERAPRVVETENVFPKPMSVDEATLQLDVANGNFLVFTDAITNHINVLYRRDDGDYGLIDTGGK